MTENIDIDELERVSSKEKSVRDRMERIVAAYERVENRDRKHRPSYGYRDHEVEACAITISIERCCCGSTDFEELHVPARLVNSTDAELDAWFEKRREQIKVRNDLDEARKDVAGHDAKEKDLLSAFKNLHDPGWIHAKIVEVNGLINENNVEFNAMKSKTAGLEKEIDKEFDLVDKDGNPIDSILRHDKAKKGTKLFPEGSWRDICATKTDPGDAT